jgi:LuxR family maltose regulon positive regulatory protein
MQEGMQVWNHYGFSPWWGLPPLPAFQARLWLAVGDVASAAGWAQRHSAVADGELVFQREVEQITLARVLLAQDDTERALGLLGRLRAAARAGGRVLRVIEIDILQALAYRARGETTQAIAALERALVLAEPGGFCRIFVDQGPPMAQLLYQALGQSAAPDYAANLLAAFPDPNAPATSHPQPPVRSAVGSQISRSQSSAPPAAGAELVEPLSEREIEVLQLIAQGLTNPEIAARLYLSLNTIKAHTRNIYGKLDVHNRTQAVAQGRALGILSSGEQKR